MRSYPSIAELRAAFFGPDHTAAPSADEFEHFLAFVDSFGRQSDAQDLLDKRKRVSGLDITDLMYPDLELSWMLRIGGRDAALARLRRLTGHKPRQWGPRYLQALFTLGDLETCLDVANDLFEKTDGEFPFAFRVVQIHLLAGRTDEAYRFFDRNKRDAWQDHGAAYARIVDAIRTAMATEHFLTGPTPSVEAFREFLKAVGKLYAFRHNFDLGDGTTVFDHTADHAGSPGPLPDLARAQWKCLTDALDLTGCTHALDVGGADGFFSVQLARSGMEVTYLEPDILLCMRARAFFRFFGVEDKITIDPSPLLDYTPTLKRTYDVCLALGHLETMPDMLGRLGWLTRASGRLVVETAQDPGAVWTDLDAHRFQGGAGVSLDWIVQRLQTLRFEPTPVDAWATFADANEQTRGRRMVVAQRI